jgi:sugar-specific transcriptional regulator TrmB
MPSTPHVLDEARDLLRKRLEELDEERKRLERALVELGEKAIGRAGRRPGRPRGSGKKARGRKRGRRKGTRADQAVKLVEGSPGITASDIAKTMKIKPNYLYRVLGDLEKEGRVKKKGRQYFPGK